MKKSFLHDENNEEYEVEAIAALIGDDEREMIENLVEYFNDYEGEE